MTAPVIPPKRTPLAGLLAALWVGFKLGLLALVIFQTVHICCLDNVHIVLDGHLYRTGQLSGDKLTKLTRRLGIRTVVNLRGPCAGRDWYVEESRAGARLNLSQEDVCLSAGHMPSVPEIRRLVEVIERSEPPILIHCFRGVDRTGLTAMMSLLLKTDSTLAEARRAMSLRYLHLSFGRTGHLDVFDGLYEKWLEAREFEHSPERFRYWILHEYTGHVCTGRVEVLGTVVRGDPTIRPVVPDDTLSTRPNSRLKIKVPTGTAFGIRVRFHNTSHHPWRFHRAENVGVHATFRYEADDGSPQHVINAGSLNRMVEPGESFDLTFPFGPVDTSFRRKAQIEMYEAGHCYFHEVGMPYLNVELEGS